MKLKTGTAALIMVILMVFSIGFGAYRGWKKERALVNETYTGLETMLHTRVESAYNLLTVASRHLSADHESIRRVTEDRDILEGRRGLQEKARANERLTQDAAELLKELAALESVQNDSRDRMYVTDYLPQMLTESESLTAKANYNTAAREFNASFNASISGWIARLMGIGPAEEFSAQ